MKHRMFHFVVYCPALQFLCPYLVKYSIAQGQWTVVWPNGGMLPASRSDPTHDELRQQSQKTANGLKEGVQPFQV